MVYAGRIDSVYLDRAGSDLTADAPTGTQVLPVGFPVDFDQSGGTLQHDPTGNLYDYTAVDIDAETVTLADPLSGAGAFLSPTAMGEASYTSAVSDWETWTGNPLKVTRQYYALSSFPTTDANLTFDIANGIKCCIDLKPAFNPTSSTDLANLDAMLAHWQSLGLEAEVSLWAEPFNNGLTAAQCIAMWNFYGPTVRKYYPAVFCTSSLSAQSNSENTYYPGDSAVDKIATDLYAVRWLSGTRLDVAASVADAAVPPKPFGLWEFGASPVGVNLLTGPNTDAESGVGTWTGAGNATVARSTSHAHGGAASRAMTSVAAGDMTIAHCAAASITTQGLPCSPGNSIACSSWLRAATSARSCQVGATFYTSGGALISSLFGSSVSDSTSGFTLVTSTVTAPATAAFCRLAVKVLATGAASEVHFSDDESIGNTSVGQSQADVTAYLSYVESFFATRLAAGKRNADLILFNSGSVANFTSAIVSPISLSSDYRLALLPSGVSFALGDILNVWPLSTDARAVVKLADSEDEAPVDARITHALRPLLAEGARDPGMGESVILDIVGSDWVVTDLSGEIPQLEIDATSFVGDDFVINSAGTFYYSGAPALGNLAQSIANLGGTDDYGNAYIQGVVSYFPGNTPLFAQQFNGVSIQFYTATSAAGPWTEQGGSSWNVSGGLDLFTIISGLKSSLQLRSDGFTNLIGTGGLWLTASPDNVVSDTILANFGGSAASWQGLGSGTGVSGFTAANSRWMLLPTGFVHVDLRVTFGTAGAGPITFANAIPAAYRPSGGTDIRMPMSRSNPASAEAHAFVSQSTGQVQIVALSSTMLGNYDVQFQYPII